MKVILYFIKELSLIIDEGKISMLHYMIGNYHLKMNGNHSEQTREKHNK